MTSTFDFSADGPRNSEHLVVLMEDFIERISRKLLSEFPYVKRWEETADICQQAAMKLHLALQKVQPADRRHLENLTAVQIRRTLIDLARKYSRSLEHHEARFTPRSQHGNVDALLAQQTNDQGEHAQLVKWTQLHEAVAELPVPEQEVFHLIWYRGLSKSEIVDLLGVSIHIVQRRWQNARLFLREKIDPSILDET